MATPTAGRFGRFYMDISTAGNGSAEPVPLISKFSAQRDAPTADGTSLGDTSTVSIQLLPGGEISFEGFLDPADAGVAAILGDGVQSRKVYAYLGTDRTKGYFYTTGAASGTVDTDVAGLVKITGGKIANATSLIFKAS